MARLHRVLICRCERYDAEAIAAVVKDGMAELGVQPRGRVLLKPNTVIAHPEIFPHAFTRAEFLDGVLAATRQTAAAGADIAVGERSGIVIPTRYAFRNAGYPAVLRRHGVRAVYFDEEPHVPVAVDAPGRLRDHLWVPRAVAGCDFLINLPKFKAHPWCRLTLSLKNFIGLQDDRHRLVDHNLYLEQKIADLQSVIQPGFIAVDAITAGQKMMLTPTPFDMGVIVMGVNSCAVDTVCCHMVNVDPADLIHLRLAAERGFGPADLSQIELGGDVSLEEIQRHNRGFQFCLERIDDYFRDSPNLRCTVGRFPAGHSPDYCWGGCPGSLQEAMHIFRGFDPAVEERMGKVHYVVGEVEGPLDLQDGERLVFAGDCTRWEGTVDGRPVRIESRYRQPGQVDESRTRPYDMLARVGKAAVNTLMRRGARHIRIPGCPVSVADHVFYLSACAGIPNPLFDWRLAVPNTAAYVKMRLGRLANRWRAD